MTLNSVWETYDAVSVFFFFLNSVLNLSFGLSPCCICSHISPTAVSDVLELELGGRRRDQDIR